MADTLNRLWVFSLGAAVLSVVMLVFTVLLSQNALIGSFGWSLNVQSAKGYRG